MPRIGAASSVHPAAPIAARGRTRLHGHTATTAALRQSGLGAAIGHR